MCGIAGIVSLNNISDRLVESIRNMEYRGYDSCGIAMLNGSKSIRVLKNTGSVEEVNVKERFSRLKGNTGIAHTRWATHGGVSKANSHPHNSCHNEFSITHNGIISNYTTLRASLVKKGHKFRSQTDSEVIAHLVEDYYSRFGSVERALISAVGDLEGSYAVALVTFHEPGRIYCARNESPLLLGLGNDANYIASDFNAFIGHTKDTVFLEDGEYAVVTHDSYSIKKLATSNVVSRRVQKLTWDPEMARKGGFPHYMLKEIYDQGQVINNAMDVDRKLIHDFAEMALDKKLFITGVGTTFYVAQLGQYYFSQYAGITPMVISSDEFGLLAQPDAGSAVIAVSQSGETYDTLTALRYAKSRKAHTAAIVNVMGSSMARMVDNLILQGSGPEICVISTKAALAQMIILARIALQAGVMNGKLKQATARAREKDIKKLPDLLEKLLNEKSGFIHSIARRQSHIQHWLFLGRGRYYPIARESALKMKEVSYVHAEGMPSGFLKHGTIALIDDSMNSVVFTPPEEEKELYKLTMSSAEEIRARNGYILGITFESKSKKETPFTDQLTLPKTPPFTAPFMQMVAAQLLSYFTATTLKRNVDRPRSLAKSVTVA